MAGFKIEYLVEFRGTGRIARQSISTLEFTTIYDWSKPKDLPQFYTVLFDQLDLNTGEFEIISITKKIEPLF